jgi:hypothetical protein
MCVLVATAVTAAQPAAAAETTEADASTLAYWCNVNVTGGTDNCNGGGVVGVTNPGGAKRLASVDLNAIANWGVFVLRTRVCNATGFSTHIADSPTNNGFGGDSGSTRHDAEAHANGTTLLVFRSDVGTGPVLACQFTGPSSVSGCVTQEWRVLNDQFNFDANVAVPNDLDVCNHPWIFDFVPYDEADSEDPNNLYADKFYVGLNGIYNDPFNTRPGSGVQQACFYLSTDPAATQAQVGAACGF